MKPTYNQLLKQLENAVHTIIQWKPDFLDPDEMKEFDDNLNEIENTIHQAKGTK